MTDTPVLCRFDHPALAALDRPSFRLTEGDRLPAMAIRLDGSEAVLTLHAVGKLFGIAPDSADARMLRLIGDSLRFVACLRLGDPLPAEVLTGKASWSPSDYHRQIASARLQLQLVNWIGGGTDGQQITSQMLVVSVDDPAIRPRVQEALRHAAGELQVDGGSAVAALIEELAIELSFIEALRERLLGRMQAMARRLHRFVQESGGLSAARRETLLQVARLAATGLSQVAPRFDQVDAQAGEIIAALRNLDQQRSFLRPNRDWLYSTLVAWEPLLTDWEDGPLTLDGERLWRVLDRAYRFLAPRFMPVQEWQSMMAAPAADRSKALTW